MDVPVALICTSMYSRDRCLSHSDYTAACMCPISISILPYQAESFRQCLLAIDIPDPAKVKKLLHDDRISHCLSCPLTINGIVPWWGGVLHDRSQLGVDPVLVCFLSPHYLGNVVIDTLRLEPLNQEGHEVANSTDYLEILVPEYHRVNAEQQATKFNSCRISDSLHLFYLISCQSSFNASCFFSGSCTPC
jgi:hypothetical protein